MSGVILPGELEADDIPAILAERRIMQSALGLDPYALALMLFEGRYWSFDPERIEPAVIAHCNRIMGRMGIITKTSPLRLASALIGSAVNDDLTET